LASRWNKKSLLVVQKLKVKQIGVFEPEVLVHMNLSKSEQKNLICCAADAARAARESVGLSCLAKSSPNFTRNWLLLYSIIRLFDASTKEGIKNSYKK